MKILVFSDSHGVLNHMFSVVELEKPELVLHLGDHDRDSNEIVLKFPHVLLRAVRGNCDGSSHELDIDEFVLGGKRFIMTHGHLFNVKIGLDKLTSWASSRNADIVLYGHTHRAHSLEKENTLFVNPGSIGLGSISYAIIMLANGKLDYELKNVVFDNS